MLYQFGGIAVPDRALNSFEARRRNSPQETYRDFARGTLLSQLFVCCRLDYDRILWPAMRVAKSDCHLFMHLIFLHQGKPIQSIPLFAL